MADLPIPLPSFPLDRLPPGWATWLDMTARRLGTPVDYLAGGMLAALCGVTGAGIVAEPVPGWREPLVLWLCLVGGPSSGKTPALAAARRLLVPIERSLAAGDERRRRAQAERTERARAADERWRLSCAAAVRTGRATPSRPADAAMPLPFVPSQLVVGDATLAALADVVAGNPRGVVLWRDELAAWLAALSRAPGDRAAWLEAWSAQPVVVNRRSRGEPLRLERFPLSVVGGVQPERLAEALATADDGLAARFLYISPAPAPWQPLAERLPQAAGRRVARLALASDEARARQVRRIAGLTRDPADPLVLRFRRDAVAAFDRFCAARHGEQLGGEGGLLAGWRGKAGGTVARLAGLLALLSSSSRSGRSPSIGKREVEDAIALWSDYFLPHAARVLRGEAGDEHGELGARVVRWLRRSNQPVVSRLDIRRHALGQRVDAAGADIVIAGLERSGVLMRLPRAAHAGAGRPAERWRVSSPISANAEIAGIHRRTSHAAI